MVARSEKGFALCCIPCIAVSDLVACYRPSVRTYAVTSKILYKELSKMTNIFTRAKSTTAQILTNQTQNNKKTIENHKKGGYTASVIFKKIAKRDNLNNITKADNSTPLKRAFFVCASINVKPCYNGFSSMVARDRKGFALCCIPWFAVCHPVTCYRLIVTNKAVIPENLAKELSKMTNIFTRAKSTITTLKNLFTFAKLRKNHTAIKELETQSEPVIDFNYNPFENFEYSQIQGGE